MIQRVRTVGRMVPLVVCAFAIASLQAQNDSAKPKSQSSSGDDDARTPSTAVPRKQPGQLSTAAAVPPLTVGEKFQYRVVGSFGVRGLIGNLTGAAIGQATNTPGEWGQGWGAYGKRYASGLGGTLCRQVFAFTLESAFHEDPRYFPSTERSKRARVRNVLKSVVITHTDSGESEFAYARVISAFGAGQLVNTWQPASTGHVSDGLERGIIVLGVDAGFNLLQEFVPFTRPKSVRHGP
jgi:hypothetical protein